MNRKFILLLFSAAALTLSGCGASDENNMEPGETENSSVASATENTMSDEDVENSRDNRESAEERMEENETKRMSVQFGDRTVVYELNDSPAADSLYEQLPITTEVEDFSTNEKIFYPPQELDTSGTPVAEGGAGTLAYYEPWGDVVMFYDDYNENPSLFELGQVVSGSEEISEMTGTITIDIAEVTGDE